MYIIIKYVNKVNEIANEFRREENDKPSPKFIDTDQRNIINSLAK